MSKKTGLRSMSGLGAGAYKAGSSIISSLRVAPAILHAGRNSLTFLAGHGIIQVAYRWASQDLRLIRGMRPRPFTLGRGKWALDRWRRSKALKVLIERALLQGQHLLMRPLQASVCAAVHGFGLWQHRPLKLRPIASCGLIRRMSPARRTGKSILPAFFICRAGLMQSG